jgi:hypothetical protein
MLASCFIGIQRLQQWRPIDRASELGRHDIA